MGASMIHANDPNTWLGVLAASVGYYLTDQHPKEALQQDYGQFRDWFKDVDPAFARMLPEPPKDKR